MRIAVGADFEALGRQIFQLAVVEKPLPVVDRNVEGPLDSSGPQELGQFLIGVIAVIPAGGNNPSFLRAVQMIPKSALQTRRELTTIGRLYYTMGSRLLTMCFIEVSPVVRKWTITRQPRKNLRGHVAQLANACS